MSSTDKDKDAAKLDFYLAQAEIFATRVRPEIVESLKAIQYITKPVTAPRKLRPHALPAGAPYPLPPPSQRHVADLTVEQREAKRTKERLKKRRHRARKAKLTIVAP